MAATASSPSCRRRAHCRASWRCPTAARAGAIVALSTIVEAMVGHLFEGVQVLGCYQFRLTRNSDLFVDDEEVDDLRRALEGELAQRRYGAAVRLETAADCPQDMVEFLLHQFALTAVDCYSVPGPVNLNRFSAIYDLAQRADLKYAAVHAGVAAATDRRHRPVRRHPPARPAAAPPVPQLRPGDGFPAPGGRRSGRAGDQADALSHRRSIRPSSMRCWPRRWPARTSRSSSSCARASTKKPTSSCRRGCRKPARTSCTAWSATRPTPR